MTQGRSTWGTAGGPRRALAEHLFVAPARPAAAAFSGPVLWLLPPGTGDSLLPPALVGEADEPERRRRRRAARALGEIAMGEAPGAFRVALDEWGEPQLRHADGRPTGWHLSHAGRGGFSLVALHRTRIGIDLETGLPPGGLPWATLPARERAALAARPEAEQAAAFLRAWTAREAFVKRLGTGFRLAPEAICLSEMGDDLLAEAVLPGSLRVERARILTHAFKAALCDTPVALHLALATDVE